MSDFVSLLLGNMLTYLVGGIIISVLVGLFWHEATHDGRGYDILAYACAITGGLVLGRFYWECLVLFWKFLADAPISGVRPDEVRLFLENFNGFFVVCLVIGLSLSSLLALWGLYQRRLVCHRAESLTMAEWADSYDVLARAGRYLKGPALYGDNYHRHSADYDRDSWSMGELFGGSFGGEPVTTTASSSGTSSSSSDKDDNSGMVIVIGLIVLTLSLVLSFITVYVLVKGISGHYRYRMADRVNYLRDAVRVKAQTTTAMPNL